ncbi:hypothetical protein [Roseobacter sp. MH60115]|uniref:hypothetical protein n=1 Tax=Roseobacter sp. MH60115 TaxID=2785324 RepID=UPI0018A24ABD|nr:hypothetical protein [Roseobacter sp. MH60115]
MIFEVSASQVERLDANQIVSLLRRLVHAELLKHHIPLRSGSVPAQITIADGGEDGRVTWSGGTNQTDWLPCRYTIFQSKRGAITPSVLKKETWTKASQKAGETRVLNEALSQAIENSGSYIVVTATAVVGTKRDDRINAIRQGIEEAGNDPARLAEIDIYDCNKLAEWVNTHPSIALWLNSLLREAFLGGFQTHEDWSKAPDIVDIPYQDAEGTRFVAKGSEVRTWKNEKPDVGEEKNLQGMRQLIADFFESKGQAVRIIGPSGFGKTRFAFELINRDHGIHDALDVNQIVFCHYDDVKELVLNIAREMADSGSRALLIVDDCPDSIHTRLSEMVHRQESKCLAITIGVETKAVAARRNLIVQLNPASDQLICDIAGAVHEKAKGSNASLVRDLAQGFPRMAVHAARALEDGDAGLSSVEALVSRIVWGDKEENSAAFESLQLLSLFTLVGLEEEFESELAELAAFAGREASTIFGDLMGFVDRGVVVRKGDYAEVQPVPLAMRLTNMWLESNPSGTLARLFRHLSEPMKLRMVGRLRWMSWSSKVKDFARALINEALPDEAALDTEFGSKLLDRFVHLAPDTTMEHLEQLIGHKTIDDLLLFETGRRHTVWALEKLVFRRQTFAPAATLLLKLGAAENEHWGNNATGQFEGLYQLHLSGTEATPQEKLLVLDQGLSMADDRVTKICLEALDRMLDTGQFSRSAGQEVIGADEALDDWEPETYEDIFNYYREALKRLEAIALSDNAQHSRRALNSIGSHLRGLFRIEPLLDEIKAVVARLRDHFPKWPKPLMGVNDWLFFDREDASEAHQTALRAYYDELLPESDIDLLIFYSSGWATDIYDPDVMYDRDGDTDFEYASRQVDAIIERNTKDSEFFFPLIDVFITSELNSAWITVQKISAHVSDPRVLLDYILSQLGNDPELLRLPNFVSNTIAGARQIDSAIAVDCLEQALSVPQLEPHAIELIGAAGLDNSLMKRVIEYVERGAVEPRKTQSIAFGDTLNGIAPELIEQLVSKLCDRQEAGAWAAIDFLCYALHGIPLEDDRIVRAVMQSSLNRQLFERSQYSNMDWYHWCNLVEKLFDAGSLNRGGHEDLLQFILHVTDIEDYSVQLAFDDYAQKALRRMITVQPELVWSKFHDKRANIDSREKRRLDGLFDAGVGNPEQAGVLNDIPNEICISWMLEDKQGRISFILNWIELFKSGAENREWSSTFIDFIEEHIDDANSLGPVLSRLTSGVWSGSYANKLEKVGQELNALKTAVVNPVVLRWADQTLIRFEDQISAERRRDANREAEFRQ